PDSLSNHGAGRHDAGGREGNVGGGNIASGEKEVFQHLAATAAEWNRIQVRDGDVDGGGFVGSIDALGRMQINEPATVSDRVGRVARFENILFSENVPSSQATGFAFSGDGADPGERPVFRAVVSGVFHVIPNSQ